MSNLLYALGMGIARIPRLTHRQILFCDAILAGMPAEGAAVSAGYSAKTARTTGPEYLAKPAIRAELDRRRAPLLKRTDNLRERVLDELEKLAFRNLQDVTTVDEDGQLRTDFSNATRDQLAAITKLKNTTKKSYNSKGEHVATENNVEYGFADKYKGLELLGKTLGMWGSDKVTVTIDVADRLLKARQKLLGVRDAEYAEFSIVDAVKITDE